MSKARIFPSAAAVCGVQCVRTALQIVAATLAKAANNTNSLLACLIHSVSFSVFIYYLTFIFGSPLICSAKILIVWLCLCLIRSWNTRRIYRGVVNLFLFRHWPSNIFWKCTIWNINIQYKNGWYTLQKWTKPVFAFRHWGNLVTSSIYPSWVKITKLK